jgi:hypothetical protein
LGARLAPAHKFPGSYEGYVPLGARLVPARRLRGYCKATSLGESLDK